MLPKKGTFGSGGVNTLMLPFDGLIFKNCDLIPVAAYRLPSLPDRIAQANATRPVKGRLWVGYS